MEPKLEISIEKATSDLKEIQENAVNMTPVWENTVGPELDLFTKEMFETEGAIGERPWAPLTEATIAHKAKAGVLGLGTLRFTDILYGSLTDRSHPQAVSKVNPMSYVRGTTVNYAEKHMTGFTVTQWGAVHFKQAREVPARPFFSVDLPSDLMGKWVDAVAKHLTTPKGGADKGRERPND